MVKLKFRVCAELNHTAIENGLYMTRKSAENRMIEAISTEIYFRETINLGISLSVTGFIFLKFRLQI